MSMSFDASELEAYARQLGQAGEQAERRTESEVLSEAGKKFQAAAKSAAPVLTGELRDSIFLRGGKGYRDIGSDLRYARYVEFGTYKDRPQPYLFRTVAPIEREMLDKLGKIGTDALD